MTMIENDHFNCAKTVSCKVTVKTQKGYRWYQGHWGLLGGVGGCLGEPGGVGVSGMYLRLAESVGTQGLEGV